MLTTIITAIVCSAICSFLIGRIYLNRLYASSNAGHRQAAIIQATKELIRAGEQEDHTMLYALQERHRHSLGALFSRMLTVYGRDGATTKPVAPSLMDTTGGDSWSFYEKHIRPVKEDMNNNSFIGWLPFVHNVKLMTTIWQICHYAEDIVANLAMIAALAAAHDKPLPYSINEDCLLLPVTDETADAQYAPYLAQLRAQYTQLQLCWKKWLTLNDLLLI